jgi:Nucleotidyl transferase AbiEii toxin, Type IV TA system
VPSGGLTRLQARTLELLAGQEPPWTLTGGGALVGFHLRHRRTRDLDFFWHGLERLGDCGAEVVRRLRAAGLAVESLQRSEGFQRLRVADGSEVVILDLVAEPVAAVEPFVEVAHGAVRIRVDTPHEILVNKLCALLGRAELRDLVDVRALLAAGCDLGRAVRDAPRKDGGFSPLTLAWILRGLPISAMAEEEGVAPPEAEDLTRFRDDLVARLTAAARPDA